MNYTVKNYKSSVVLVTRDPDVLRFVCEQASLFQCLLIVVDIGLCSLEVFSRNLSFTWVRAVDDSAIVAANRGIEQAQGKGVLLLSDETYKVIKHLSEIERVVETFLRVGSVTVRSDVPPGTRVVGYNPLWGTWYQRDALRAVGSFDGAIRDTAVAAYRWAGLAQRQGWVQLEVYQDRVEIGSGGAELAAPGSPAEPTRDGWVVPHRNSGTGARQPWSFPVTVAIPHYGGHYRLLLACLESWRLQTRNPYICVYDTGTCYVDYPTLFSLESLDTEIHLCRWHGQRYILSAVSLAYSHAFDDCRTSYLLLTHNDILPISQTILEELISQCDSDHPVVGYESLDQTGDIGTQLTLVHVPTLDRLRIGFGVRPGQRPLEQASDQLRQVGIVPRWIGKERAGRVQTPHFEHVGGVVSTQLYRPQQWDTIQNTIEEVIHTTEYRLKIWRGL